MMTFSLQRQHWMLKPKPEIYSRNPPIISFPIFSIEPVRNQQRPLVFFVVSLRKWRLQHVTINPSFPRDVELTFSLHVALQKIGSRRRTMYTSFGDFIGKYVQRWPRMIPRKKLLYKTKQLQEDKKFLVFLLKYLNISTYWNMKQCPISSMYLHVLNPNLPYITIHWPYQKKSDFLWTDFC